jgi:hypothetical protein
MSILVHRSRAMDILSNTEFRRGEGGNSLCSNGSAFDETFLGAAFSIHSTMQETKLLVAVSASGLTGETTTGL